MISNTSAVVVLSLVVSALSLMATAIYVGLTYKIMKGTIAASETAIATFFGSQVPRLHLTVTRDPSVVITPKVAIEILHLGQYPVDFSLDPGPDLEVGSPLHFRLSGVKRGDPPRRVVPILVPESVARRLVVTACIVGGEASVRYVVVVERSGDSVSINSRLLPVNGTRVLRSHFEKATAGLLDRHRLP